MEFDFRSKSLLTLVALLLVGVFAATTARADELYGRVRGTVTDASGAVLPGVQVKVMNVDTGISKELTTGSDGAFLFVNLIPGNYSLSASKNGFKLFQARGITVGANQIYVQNVNM